MNLSNHNQVIIKCLFILNTVFTVLACLGLYLTDLSICVCVCKCSHVWWGFLIFVSFCVWKVFPNARGWTFLSERWKQLGPGFTKPKGWYHGSYRMVFGLGLMDFSFVFMNQLFLDLCVFLLLRLSIRWDVLRVVEIYCTYGRSVLCSWLESPGFFFLQDLVKMISHEHTWVCFWSCLEMKT